MLVYIRYFRIRIFQFVLGIWLRKMSSVKVQGFRFYYGLAILKLTEVADFYGWPRSPRSYLIRIYALPLFEQAATGSGQHQRQFPLRILGDFRRGCVVPS